VILLSRVFARASSSSSWSTRWVSSRSASRVTPGRLSSSSRTLNAAQVASSSRRGRTGRRSRRSSGAVTSRWLIWFSAWVRALVALRVTTRRARKHSTAPSWVFGVALASPDSTARAAAMASVLPWRRRSCRLSRPTSTTLIPCSVRCLASAAPSSCRCPRHRPGRGHRKCAARPAAAGSRR